jgi:hypothetical protein
MATKTKTLSPWSDEHEGIIRDIIKMYSEGGIVRWTRAFNEHPEWKEDLTKHRSLAAVLVKGCEQRKKMEGGRIKSSTAQKSPKKKRVAWTPQQMMAIQGVINNYTTGKGKHRVIDYAGAFADHRDWRDALSQKSASAIYSMGQKVASGSVKTKLVNLIDSAESIPANVKTASKPMFAVNGCPNCLLSLKPLNEAYPEPLPFCPRCTCPLGVVRTAMRVLDKVTHRNGTV